MTTANPVPLNLHKLLTEGPEPSDWGGWTLNPELRILELLSPHGNYVYEIDLDTCTTSAEVLDWLCQVAGKVWADDAVLAGLVRAIDDVLHPQAHLCSGGIPRTLPRDRIAALVAEEHTRRDGR
jgi:hypothetical protein